jgi:hypothetical protein
MMAYVKYCVESANQFVAMYGLGDYFGDPQTVTLSVAFLCSVLTYTITLVNYK